MRLAKVIKEHIRILTKFVLGYWVRSFFRHAKADLLCCSPTVFGRTLQRVDTSCVYRRNFSSRTGFSEKYFVGLFGIEYLGY
jgi:hypothetical protein